MIIYKAHMSIAYNESSWYYTLNTMMQPKIWRNNYLISTKNCHTLLLNINCVHSFLKWKMVWHVICITNTSSLPWRERDEEDTVMYICIWCMVCGMTITTSGGLYLWVLFHKWQYYEISWYHSHHLSVVVTTTNIDVHQL